MPRFVVLDIAASPPCRALADEAMDSGAIVDFDHVAMRYGQGPEILREVTFALQPGSFHFVTGASGAGKSTLLKLIYLGARPSQGRIALFGEEIASLPRDQVPAIRRQIGIVFQEFRLLDHLTISDNVALPLRIAGLPEDEIRGYVTELLTWVGLRDQLDAKPPTLSGGQQKRAAIARAVISRPRLLLADEPTGNVDDRMAVRLLHLLQELNRLGTTIVVSSHSESLVARFDYPILHLADGRLTLQTRGNGAGSR